MTEDEMARQHHQLNGHELEQTLGDSEGQGSLAGSSQWGCRVRHDLATEQKQQNTVKRNMKGTMCFYSPECELTLDLKEQRKFEEETLKVGFK